MGYSIFLQVGCSFLLKPQLEKNPHVRVSIKLCVIVGLNLLILLLSIYENGYYLNDDSIYTKLKVPKGSPKEMFDK